MLTAVGLRVPGADPTPPGRPGRGGVPPAEERGERAVWREDGYVREGRLDDGTVDECHVLISGVGFLSVPRAA